MLEAEYEQTRSGGSPSKAVLKALQVGELRGTQLFIGPDCPLGDVTVQLYCK